MNNYKFFLKIVLIFFPGIILIGAEVDIKGAQKELGIYEHLDSIVSGNIVLYNEDSVPQTLESIVDMPTVLVPVYYSCPGICPQLLEGVAEVVDRAKIDPGKDYKIVTYSFDSADRPYQSKEKREDYLKLVKHKNAALGWHFYTADQQNITKLLNQLGYKVERKGEHFIHPSAIVVLSPQRKITRYLHGTYFLPFDLKMAVVEASKGKSGPTINKILNYCFAYDPEGKKYVFNITKVAGSIILVFALIFLLWLTLGKMRKK